MMHVRLYVEKVTPARHLANAATPCDGIRQRFSSQAQTNRRGI